MHGTAQRSLWRRVGGREHTPAVARKLRLAHLTTMSFGDAEVQELHPAFGRDQDVRWLQVAMHDEAAVRHVDGVAASGKEPQPVLQRQVESPAGIGDGLAFHQFHDEIGPPVGG